MSPKNDNTSQPHEPVSESHEGEHHHSSNEHSDEEPTKKSKYDHDGKHAVIGLIIYTVLQFITLVLVVVATPIGMFKINDTWRGKLYPTLTTDKKLCVTAWGMKLGCGTRGYYNRDFTNTFCYRVRLDFKIVEAFCLMTIAFMFMGIFMGVFSILQMISKSAAGAIGAFAMILCLIPWGVLAGMYNQNPCCETSGWNTNNIIRDCTGNNTNVNEIVPPFKTMGSFGPAFGLLVAAWALQVIAIVFAFQPWL